MKLKKCSHIWPVSEKAGNPPDGWSGWPEKKQFAFVLTHDVDTAKGQDKSYRLMGDLATFIDLMPVWLFSAALLIAFLVVRLGVIKSWFVLKPLPGLLSARMIYAALPLGLAFLVLGVGGMFPYESIIHKAGLPAFFLLGFTGFLFT